jgi:hypothetical protein
LLSVGHLILPTSASPLVALSLKYHQTALDRLVWFRQVLLVDLVVVVITASGVRKKHINVGVWVMK